MLFVAIFFLVFILVVSIYFLYRNHTHLSNIPKPPCNLILGHMLDFKEPTAILEKMTNLSIKYGGLMRIYIPPAKPTVFITDYEIVKTLLTSEAAMDKSTYYDYLKVWLGEGLLTSRGEHWRQHRKILNPCFGHITLLKSFIGKFESLGNVLIEKLGEQIQNPSIDVLLTMKMFTFDVLCETSMGVSRNCPRSNNLEYFRSVSIMCRIGIERMASVLNKFNFFFRYTKQYQEQLEAVKVIDAYIGDMIEKYKIKRENSEFDQDHKLTFLEMLLQRSDKLKETDIKDEINTFMFGGHDTTAIGLAFILYCLAHHPECQEKILEEQRNIFGELNEQLTVTYNDLQEMKYLEMVINEALRIYPPIPTIGRKLTEDIELEGGIILPKTLSVAIFIYGCHHNPSYFPEPEKFNPERFLQDDIRPLTYLPFSYGRRNCIGKKFAILQMKSCISKIVRNYRLLPSEPEYEMKLVPAVTLMAKNGIKISLEKR